MRLYMTLLLSVLYASYSAAPGDETPALFLPSALVSLLHCRACATLPPNHHTVRGSMVERGWPGGSPAPVTTLLPPLSCRAPALTPVGTDHSFPKARQLPAP